MKTPLGLMRICTLSQGVTHSMVHMRSVMNKIMKEFVPEKPIPFMDDISIKGCKVKITNFTLGTDECRRFINDHIKNVDKILKMIEEVDLILFIDKSKFRVDEILVVGHLRGSYGRKTNPEKVDVITRMKACSRLLK